MITLAGRAERSGGRDVEILSPAPLSGSNALGSNVMPGTSGLRVAR